jgi:hypothetical protein
MPEPVPELAISLPSQRHPFSGGRSPHKCYNGSTVHPARSLESFETRRSWCDRGIAKPLHRSWLRHRFTIASTSKSSGPVLHLS